MRYVFNEDDKSISERICQINGIDIKDIDVSTFKVDEDIDLLNKFKNFIMDNKLARFLIIGDYDCDGLCATSIMKKLLDDLNIKNNYYIPSRSKDGYGISMGMVNMAIENKFDVVITVDNGAVAYEQITALKKANIKTVVIDHHNYELAIDADLFIHPNLFDDKYSDMCASGLCALLSNNIRQDDLTYALGGLATIADLVSVLNYNRYLIKKALKIISEGNIYPINYLLKSNEVSVQSLQFNVIPKINAVSRLDDMLNVNFVVKYLLADDLTCMHNVSKIETINEQRKVLTKKMYEQSLELIEEDEDIIVVASDKFSEGLCGLLANKLLFEYRKPILIFAIVEGQLRGSGRSLANFDIHEYLSGCSDLFTSFGGHSQALGLSMDLDKFGSFVNYLNEHPINLKQEESNVLLLKQEDINFDLFNEIQSLQPFGTNFKLPLLGIKNVQYQNKILVGSKYPKFLINDLLSAIYFKLEVDSNDFEYMIGNLKSDECFNNRKLSFVIEDLV